MLDTTNKMEFEHKESRKEESDEEKSVKNFLVAARIIMSWIRNNRRGITYSADSALLHGNGILLCQKLTAPSRLVYQYKAVQEASGELCTAKGNDLKDKVFNRRNGNSSNGGWIYYDE